jgi:two-component system sensor histidine kinase KdpD
VTTALAAHPAVAVAVRVLVAVGAVVITTGVLAAADADLTFAAITLLVVVVAASALGYVPGLVAALGASVSLIYFFTPPRHSFAIDQPDGVLAIVAFVAASLVAGTAVARLSELRRRSELAAREARLRLLLTNDLAGGAAVGDVLDVLARELVDLFDLATCTAIADGVRRTVGGSLPPLDVLNVSAPGLDVRMQLGRVLSNDERATLEALGAGLATALERSRLDHEARDQRVRADLDRSRAGFLTAVTHDLRTPLATIKAATGTLLDHEDGIDRTTRHELLAATYAEVSRLEGLVTKVLELTRIRSGAIRPEPGPIAVSDLVRIAVDRLGALDDGRAIVLDIDAELPAVLVDASQVEHVLGNLLENAIRHDAHGHEIVVHAASANDAVAITVADHGPGIVPEDRERVFEEFVRLGAPTDGPGTGLGLAIVRALTIANGGTVQCRETPGGGATFAVTLPAAPDDNGEPDA